MNERRLAFVTDASSTEGRAAAQALRDAGFEVHPIDASRPDAAARLVRETLRPKSETTAGENEPPGTFGEALAPYAERMRKLNLPAAFVAALLEPGATLEESAVAMRSAGMPNKNERSLTHDVLEALADAGFLRRGTATSYHVQRAADEV